MNIFRSHSRLLILREVTKDPQQKVQEEEDVAMGYTLTSTIVEVYRCARLRKSREKDFRAMVADVKEYAKKTKQFCH